MSAIIDIIVRVMNEAVVADRDAIESLIERRVRCNEVLAAHRAIQVSDFCQEGPGYWVGPLGLINGIVESSTGDKLAAIYEDSPEPGVRGRLLRFEIWRDDVHAKKEGAS